MAKLSDLPAEAVRLIVQCLSSPPANPRPNTNKAHRSFSLDHTEIEPLQALPRRHWHDYPPPPPDKLPKNPLLSLALVSPTFRECAQETLFSNVAFDNPWEASLFLRTLTRPSAEDELRMAEEKDEVESARALAIGRRPRLHRLAAHVRSLQFLWGGPCSMGMGGGSVFCEVLYCCPHLESLAISVCFLSRFKEPIMEALASRRTITKFLLLQNPDRDTPGWLAEDIVGRLFSSWKGLRIVEMARLGSRPEEIITPLIQPSIPIIQCALVKIILHEPDLHEKELSLLLKNSHSSLQTLKIFNPTRKLRRPGLCQILKESTAPALESLTIMVQQEWEPLRSPSKAIRTSDDPAINAGLLDIVFRTSPALGSLKTLHFSGNLATILLLRLLPQSIVKLAWERCDIHEPALAQILKQPDPWLPNLKCCLTLGCQYSFRPPNIPSSL
ncbi:hypothetical protein PtB15_5B72 [Puccinia triticina]|nr:hypothetical protein PtB15_5B72 [Puccinia triticina]